MTRSSLFSLTALGGLAVATATALSANAQQAETSGSEQANNATAPAAADAAPRSAEQTAPDDQLLERWRQARRGYREWLSIQQIYDPQEAAAIQAQLDERVREMSPSELADLVEDMENKLEVLFSPEAEEARQWLAQFLSVQAMYSPEQLRQMRPDIANMTAGQIRQELAQHQQRRGQTRQAQAAFEQGRQQRVDAVHATQAAQRRAAEQAAQRRSQAASASAAQFRSQYTPPRREFQLPERPRYTIGPWGGVFRTF